MPTLGSNILTLGDWAKRLDPDGKVATIVELLEQSNEVLMDMLWIEGNLPTGHRTSVRTGLPTVAWRLLNQGVQPSKSTTAQIDEATGMLEAWSEVDVDIAELNGNVAAFRLSEAKAFIEAMNQEMASTLFYGNSGLAPEEFTGLSVRFGDLTAENSRNMVSGGGLAGQTDCSSIWMVVWGDQSIHGIYPKGSKAGLIHDDFGQVTTETTAGVGGSRMRAYQERYQWKCGIALKDWRYVVRIHSIDISVNSADYIDLLTKAYHRIQSFTTGSAAIYMNRTIRQRLDLLRRDDVIAGGGLTWDTVDGKPVASYRGIPIRTTDSLLESESAIV